MVIEYFVFSFSPSKVTKVALIFDVCLQFGGDAFVSQYLTVYVKLSFGAPPISDGLFHVTWIDVGKDSFPVPVTSAGLPVKKRDGSLRQDISA